MHWAGSHGSLTMFELKCAPEKDNASVHRTRGRTYLSDTKRNYRNRNTCTGRSLLCKTNMTVVHDNRRLPLFVTRTFWNPANTRIDFHGSTTPDQSKSCSALWPYAVLVYNNSVILNERTTGIHYCCVNQFPPEIDCQCGDDFKKLANCMKMYPESNIYGARRQRTTKFCFCLEENSICFVWNRGTSAEPCHGPRSGQFCCWEQIKPTVAK